MERTQFLRSSSVEACSHAGSNGRIAVWWSLRWATMLCCSFHDCHPGVDESSMWADLHVHHVAAFHPVLREGVRAILIMIDMEDFEMTMEGTYVPVLVRHDMSCVSSWKLTCNSPRLVERQAGGGMVRPAGDLRAIAVDFSQVETLSVSDVEAKVSVHEHKECR